ncbi:glycosyl hydrolase family 18 protein [Chitinophaga rhizophila]|uniref:Carbohydrate-binding protein n=1 Tax=Chitinophaga rhizophila TaxID=2866212 RepID=A0ABS7G817_9BACT|nr:glycosyl hydrolase family 18 protein [Chitinophaga rhizophila]MBW8683801.1 carbohydrate-binding protein [Chitinophaga rhizophila]
MKAKKWIKAGLLFAAGLLLSAQIFAQFKVVGYMPSWSGSVSAIQYSKLTHINYSFALPTSTGGLQPIENPSKLSSLVSSGHANGVKVLIAIGGWNNGDDSAFETLAANATYRTNFVNAVMSFVNQYGLDGVDMDWEYPDAGASANNYLLLMQQLSTALHAQGKLLTAAVVGTGGASILSGVFNVVDFLNLMAYDYNNYEHSTYTYASQSLAYWKGRGLPASKAVLGVPFYARPSWNSYATLLANGASPNSDYFGSDYYNGLPTIRSKTNLAYDQGGGIMMWELSQDATGANSLLSAIYQVKIDRGGTNPPPPGTLIQAENYTSMSGVQIEPCTDAGGGSNVGYIETADWMAYANINFPTSGAYKVEYRIASQGAGGQLSLDLNSGATVLGYLSVPSTGGWQNWTTISHTVNVNAGTYSVGIYAQTGGWNINWIRITKVAAAASATTAVTSVKDQLFDNQEVEKAPLLFPNPVVTSLNLRGSLNQPGGNITIFDLNGKQVLNARSGITSISVDALPAGTYLLVYTKDGKKVTQKFVKK